MLNQKFNEIYLNIITEGLFTKSKDDSIEKILRQAKYFVSGFCSIKDFMKKYMKPETLNKFINEDRQRLLDNLNNAFKSSDFEKEIVKNKDIKNGINIIIQKFNVIWPKLKGLNLLKGKLNKKTIKEDLKSLLSTLPECAEILVQIFKVISKMFSFLSDKVLNSINTEPTNV